MKKILATCALTSALALTACSTGPASKPLAYENPVAMTFSNHLLKAETTALAYLDGHFVEATNQGISFYSVDGGSLARAVEMADITALTSDGQHTLWISKGSQVVPYGAENMTPSGDSISLPYKVAGLSYWSDSKVLVSSSGQDNKLLVLSPSSGEVIAEVEVTAEGGQVGPLTELEYLSGGQLLAVSGQNLLVIDLNSGKVNQSFSTSSLMDRSEGLSVAKVKEDTWLLTAAGEEFVYSMQFDVKEEGGK